MHCTPTRQLVLKKLRDVFTDEATARDVLRLLDTFTESDSESGGNRIKLAVLIGCQSRVDYVCELLDMARVDFRDLLAYAEYPAEIALPPGSSMIAEAQRRDRKRYLDWIESNDALPRDPFHH